MSQETHTHLSRRERQIMDVLYAREEASAAQVLAALPDPPSYSAVRALLRKLLDKGHVTHRRDGSRYVYRAAVAKAEARQGAVARLLKTFFAGSAADAVVNLLGSEGHHLKDEELSAIEAQLAELRRRQRSK